MDDIRPVSLEPVNGRLHKRSDFGVGTNVTISIIDTRPLAISASRRELARVGTICCHKKGHTSVTQRGLPYRV